MGTEDILQTNETPSYTPGSQSSTSPWDRMTFRISCPSKDGKSCLTGLMGKCQYQLWLMNRMVIEASGLHQGSPFPGYYEEMPEIWLPLHLCRVEYDEMPAVSCQPRTKLFWHLILYCQHPDHERLCSSVYKPPCLWYCLRAAETKTRVNRQAIKWTDKNKEWEVLWRQTKIN